MKHSMCHTFNWLTFLPFMFQAEMTIMKHWVISNCKFNITAKFHYNSRKLLKETTEITVKREVNDEDHGLKASKFI